jgi:protoporphyrinogen/coproporphyrinogen III oxidase
VGDLVTERYGRAVTDLLVEPLLSGVYAGSIDRLSAAATAPALWSAAREHRRMTTGLRAHRKRAAAVSGPVFMTLRGGLHTLVDALAERLGDRLRTSTAALSWSAARAAGAWRPPPVPSRPTGSWWPCRRRPARRLVAGAAPEVSRALGAFDTASVAVVALAYDHADVQDLPEGSGFLVPRSQGRLIKAATWSSRKWPHLAGAERFVLRASVGRSTTRGASSSTTTSSRPASMRRCAPPPASGGPPASSGSCAGTRRCPSTTWGTSPGSPGCARRWPTAPSGLHVGGAALDGVGLPARVRDAKRLADEVLGDVVASAN